MSTSRIAAVSCHDGIEDQNGPFARVIKISQFSDSEIWRNRISSLTPKFCAIPPSSPPTKIVVNAIQEPTAKTTPSNRDMPHSLGRFHFTGVFENGALSYAIARVAMSA